MNTFKIPALLLRLSKSILTRNNFIISYFLLKYFINGVIVRYLFTVGLQACQGYINKETKRLLFNAIRTSYGFDNITILTPLRKMGIFNTEKPGLYLVIAGISSVESEFQFSIVKNNSTSLAQVEVVPIYRYRDDNNNMFHTGTCSAIVQLDVHDTIFIRADKGTITYSEYSCLSVVKLK